MSRETGEIMGFAGWQYFKGGPKRAGAFTHGRFLLPGAYAMNAGDLPAHHSKLLSKMRMKAAGAFKI